jgi:short-subunit dehydrogenase involved in D-alanine esterification of teichoic acids
MERLKFKKLNEVEGKGQYQVKIKNRFATLETLHDNAGINRAWEINRKSIKISAKAKEAMVR